MRVICSLVHRLPQTYLGLSPINKGILLCNHNKKTPNQGTDVVTSLPTNPQTLVELSPIWLNNKKYYYYCPDNIFNNKKSQDVVIGQGSSVSFSLERSSVSPWLSGPRYVSRLFGRTPLHLGSSNISLWRGSVYSRLARVWQRGCSVLLASCWLARNFDLSHYWWHPLWSLDLRWRLPAFPTVELLLCPL